jgi:hypothetical protein
MLASQIITDVRRELLELGAQNFWSDTELLRHLNRAELDFVNRTRILEDSAQLNLIQGRSDYPLPANWVSARLVMHNIPGDNNVPQWRRIYPSNLEKMAQEHPNFLDNSINSQGRPQKYYIWGNVLNIIPAPNADSATTMMLFYKSKPIAITDPDSQHIHIDDTLSEALTAYVLWKAWAKEKETDLADAQKQTYFEYVAEGRRWLKKKSGDQRFRIDIDSPISFEGDNGFSPLI